jgi:hypothetical protein
MARLIKQERVKDESRDDASLELSAKVGKVVIK